MRLTSKKRMKRMVWHLKEFERLARQNNADEDADILFGIRMSVMEMFEASKRSYEMGRAAGRLEAQQ